MKCIAWLHPGGSEGNYLLPTNFLKLLKPFRLSTVLLCSNSIPQKKSHKNDAVFFPFFFCSNPISQPFNLYLFPSKFFRQKKAKQKLNFTREVWFLFLHKFPTDELLRATGEGFLKVMTSFLLLSQKRSICCYSNRTFTFFHVCKAQPVSKLPLKIRRKRRCTFEGKVCFFTCVFFCFSPQKASKMASPSQGSFEKNVFVLLRCCCLSLCFSD